MKNIFFMLFIAVASLTAQAQQKKNKNAKHEIEVSGTCDQCKKRIEKTALAVSGVKSANWDVESQQLNLIVNEEKTSLAEVEKALAKVGHDTESVKATDKDYEDLHHCCKYERKP